LKNPYDPLLSMKTTLDQNELPQFDFENMSREDEDKLMFLMRRVQQLQDVVAKENLHKFEAYSSAEGPLKMSESLENEQSMHVCFEPIEIDDSETIPRRTRESNGFFASFEFMVTQLKLSFMYHQKDVAVGNLMMLLPLNVFFLCFFYKPKTPYALICGMTTIVSCNCGALLVDWSNALGFEVLQIKSYIEKGYTLNHFAWLLALHLYHIMYCFVFSIFIGGFITFLLFLDGKASHYGDLCLVAMASVMLFLSVGSLLMITVANAFVSTDTQVFKNPFHMLLIFVMITLMGVQPPFDMIHFQAMTIVKYLNPLCYAVQALGFVFYQAYKDATWTQADEISDADELIEFLNLNDFKDTSHLATLGLVGWVFGIITTSIVVNSIISSRT